MIAQQQDQDQEQAEHHPLDFRRGRQGLHRLGKKDELVQRLQSWLEVSDEEGGAGNHSSSQGDKDDEMLEEGRERVREMLRPSSSSISSSDTRVV